MNIRQRLITLLLAIGLIPSLVLGVAAYTIIGSELEQDTADQLTSISIKQEQKINGLLQAKQEEVTKLANKYDFQVTLGQYLASARRGDHDSLVGVLQGKKIELPEMQAISVANLEGTVIASTLSGAEGQKLTSLGSPIQPNQETATTVKEDPRDGLNKLSITTLVSVNKKESAFLSVIFRIDDIVAAVQDYTGLGATGETVVVERDKDNNAVSLFPLRFDTDAALRVKLNDLELFEHAGQVFTQVNDYRGQEVMVAAKSISFANWVIATKIDRNEALAPIVQLRDTLAIIMAVSSALIIIVAFSFTRWFTRPILQIARTSERIGKGDLSARVEIKRNDELGSLGKSINSMGQSLKEFVASIESQRNRLEIILNSTEESILAIDKEGVIIIANQATAKLTDRPIQKIVGAHISDVFNWTHNTQPFSIDYTIPGSHTYEELQYTPQEDAIHYVRLIVARVSGEQEQMAAQTIITIHDETKSRELENMKLDFVSMAAHELRTPLAATRGYLELLTYKEATRLTPSMVSYVTQALNSTTELGSLINNLLDVTRIERSTLTLNLEEVDLAEEVSRAVQDARFSAQEKRVTLQYQSQQDASIVMADKIAIHEVINNLLSNAVKYTPEGGTVTISLGKHKNHFVVQVTDTGIGIPAQAIPNLFTKFYRVHGGLNSGSTGTGLGLFIAKSIIERHDGTISVDSTEGAGSTFTFTLPALKKASSGKKVMPHQSQTSNARGKRGWVTKNITR